jgi:hypothetical protein
MLRQSWLPFVYVYIHFFSLQSWPDCCFVGCNDLELGCDSWWLCVISYVSDILLPSSNITYWVLVSVKSGYSRFPVHEPGNSAAFVGLLLVKTVGTSLSHMAKAAIKTCVAPGVRPYEMSSSICLLAIYPSGGTSVHKLLPGFGLFVCETIFSISSFLIFLVAKPEGPICC